MQLILSLFKRLKALFGLIPAAWPEKPNSATPSLQGDLALGSAPLRWLSFNFFNTFAPRRWDMLLVTYINKK